MPTLPRELCAVVRDFLMPSVEIMRMRKAAVLLELRHRCVQRTLRDILRRIRFRRVLETLINLLPVTTALEDD